MTKKIAIFVIFIATLFTLTTNTAHAKRRLPQASQPVTSKPTAKSTTTTNTATVAKGISSKVRFRSDRNAIIVTFSNLSIAQKVEYSLSYNAKGTTQGAVGTLSNLNGGPATRELLFGSCSKNVCIYETNIQDARFTVTTTLQSGIKVIKPYRLKV